MRGFSSLFFVTTDLYRGLQVGWHKFATKFRACAHFGGDFELKIPRMREFSSQILGRV